MKLNDSRFIKAAKDREAARLEPEENLTGQDLAKLRGLGDPTYRLAQEINPGADGTYEPVSFVHPETSQTVWGWLVGIDRDRNVRVAMADDSYAILPESRIRRFGGPDEHKQQLQDNLKRLIRDVHASGIRTDLKEVGEPMRFEDTAELLTLSYNSRLGQPTQDELLSYVARFHPTTSIVEVSNPIPGRVAIELRTSADKAADMPDAVGGEVLETLDPEYIDGGQGSDDSDSVDAQADFDKEAGSPASVEYGGDAEDVECDICNDVNDGVESNVDFDSLEPDHPHRYHVSSSGDAPEPKLAQWYNPATPMGAAMGLGERAVGAVGRGMGALGRGISKGIGKGLGAINNELNQPTMSTKPDYGVMAKTIAESGKHDLIGKALTSYINQGGARALAGTTKGYTTKTLLEAALPVVQRSDESFWKELVELANVYGAQSPASPTAPKAPSSPASPTAPKSPSSPSSPTAPSDTAVDTNAPPDTAAEDVSDSMIEGASSISHHDTKALSAKIEALIGEAEKLEGPAKTQKYQEAQRLKQQLDNLQNGKGASMKTARFKSSLSKSAAAKTAGPMHTALGIAPPALEAHRAFSMKKMARRGDYVFAKVSWERGHFDHMNDLYVENAIRAFVTKECGSHKQGQDFGLIGKVYVRNVDISKRTADIQFSSLQEGPVARSVVDEGLE